MTRKESLSRQNFVKKCRANDIGNAHRKLSQTTMTLTGYDQKMDRKTHFIGVALCAVCADLYARALSSSHANPNCQRWLENLFFSARAWESISFNNLLEQLFQRVSPSLGLQIVAPKLISALWAETVANIGRVQKRNDKILHNVVACSIDAPCSVEMVWQLGPLALVHVSFDW